MGEADKPVAVTTLWPRDRQGPYRRRARPSIAAQGNAARAIAEALVERHHLTPGAGHQGETVLAGLADALLRYHRAWNEPKPRASNGPRRQTAQAFTKARRQLKNLLAALSARDRERAALWARKLRRSLEDGGVFGAVTLAVQGLDWQAVDRLLAQPSKLSTSKLGPLRGALDALPAGRGGRDPDRLAAFLKHLVWVYRRGGGASPGLTHDRESGEYSGPLFAVARDALDAIGPTARDAIRAGSDEGFCIALGRRLSACIPLAKRSKTRASAAIEGVTR